MIFIPDFNRTSALDGMEDSGGGSGGSADRMERVGDFTKSYMFSSSLSLGRCTFSPLDIILGVGVLLGAWYSMSIGSGSEHGIRHVKPS